MFICSILITIALSLNKESAAGDSGVGVFLVASTLLFVAFFGLGPGSVPWMITSELFTQGPRPAAVAVATLVNWAANTLVGFAFDSLARAAGQFAFLPFPAAIGILGGFLFVYLPETKGRTVEEVADEMAAPSAWRGEYNKEAIAKILPCLKRM